MTNQIYTCHSVARHLELRHPDGQPEPAPVVTRKFRFVPADGNAAAARITITIDGDDGPLQFEEGRPYRLDFTPTAE